MKESKHAFLPKNPFSPRPKITLYLFFSFTTTPFGHRVFSLTVTVAVFAAIYHWPLKWTTKILIDRDLVRVPAMLLKCTRVQTH